MSVRSFSGCVDGRSARYASLVVCQPPEGIITNTTRKRRERFENERCLLTTAGMHDYQRGVRQNLDFHCVLGSTQSYVCEVACVVHATRVREEAPCFDRYGNYYRSGGAQGTREQQCLAVDALTEAVDGSVQSQLTAH